jgi:hypothetical protein
MIELKCKNCGGKLSTADDDVFVGDDTAIVRHGSTLQCDHCGTEHLPGEELAVPVRIHVDVHQEIDSVGPGGTVIGVQISLDKPE